MAPGGVMDLSGGKGESMDMLKRLVTVVVAGVLALVLLVVAWQWYRLDTSITFFWLARDYLHNDMGLPLPVVTVVTAAGAIALFAVLGTLLLRPTMAVAAMLVLLLVALPVSYWLSEFVAPTSCFDRQTRAPLCERWQSPEGCRIVRKDGARPPSPWRLLHAATEEDVAYCGGTLTEEQRQARNPRALQSDSCIGQAFFDPTGTPLVFWSVDDKAIELWDREGRHPITGMPLKAITAEVARKYCDQLAAAKRERDEAIERDRLAAQAAETQRLQLEAKAEHPSRNDSAMSPPVSAPAVPEQGHPPAPDSTGAPRSAETVLPRELPQAPPRAVDSFAGRDPYSGIVVR